MIRILAPALILALLALGGDATEPAPAAWLAWFTDAEFPDSVRGPSPSRPLPNSDAGGVSLLRAVPVENPLLARDEGVIGFWVRPLWDGSDQRRHVLLRAGDPAKNGLLVEKSAANVLRFVMASPAKVTAARADVSDWRAGEWHHVVCAWLSRNGEPLGTVLYLDRKAVAGPVAGGNRFLDPAALTDRRVMVGDETSQAFMAQLVFRHHPRDPGAGGLVPLVYRDYFRTAPYTSIEIDPEPMRVPSDRNVVCGYEHQFGLLAVRDGRPEPVTDFATRYGQWAEFDAKPFITWSASDPAVATVDGSGRVRGVAPGEFVLTAKYRGMTATREVRVIPAKRPDLDIVLVSLLPRYRVDAEKNRPAPGDTVSAVVRVQNFGLVDAPPGVEVRFGMIRAVDDSYRVDPNEAVERPRIRTIAKSLPPFAEATVRFEFPFPEHPTWLRVAVDPEDRVPEICEANNVRCFRSDARTARFACVPDEVRQTWRDRRMNHVGSFSFYDWTYAELERMNVLLRESFGPTTGPGGIHESWRLDAIYPLLLDVPWEEEPYMRFGRYYEGGFPFHEALDLMRIDAAVLHEFGHTCLSLPDLYGHPIRKESVLLTDPSGDPYAGGPLLPRVFEDLMPYSNAFDVPIGQGYRPLMVQCHLWLHPAHAGQIEHYAGQRKRPFWFAQGSLVPLTQVLEILDLEDRPLPGALVSCYPSCDGSTPCGEDRYFPDRPKFCGTTNEKGEYVFPRMTDPDWDDPATDRVDGAFPVWNPFGRPPDARDGDTDVAATSHAFGAEGKMLLKIQSGEGTEFAWLTLTDLNECYFRGERSRGVVVLRTSLLPSPAPARRHPAAGSFRPQKTNLAPVLDVPERIVVRAGEPFTVEARGKDPEGEPLLFRWRQRGTDGPPAFVAGPVYRGNAPKEIGAFDLVASVIDGLRVTARSIRVEVLPGKDDLLLPTALGGIARWRYTTEDPGEHFADVRYSVSGWNRGRAGFGWGNPPNAQVETEWTTHDIWLRRSFHLGKVPDGEIRLFGYHDDEMEVWLNGTLAARLTGWTTRYETFPITAEARATLRSGRNVIAVHCHNGFGAAFVDVGLVRVRSR